jgi:two-component system alkaline phosphatase synthesis response regulator PhoP
VQNQARVPHGVAENSKTKILVVDDDRQLLREIRTHLEKLGYEVATAEDGTSALKLTQSFSPNLIVLDINFPDSKKSRCRSIDGVEILGRLRESGNLPVLMLSTTNISAVKVMALSMGADDYLTKPVEMKELSARIGAVLRRTGSELQAERVLSAHRLRLDPNERRVWKDDILIDLSGVEFDILYTLARRPEHVFSREKIIESAWKRDTCCVLKSVDVHIGHIRKKIEDDPRRPAFIVTVRGIGYRFEDVA